MYMPSPYIDRGYFIHIIHNILIAGNCCQILILNHNWDMIEGKNYFYIKRVLTLVENYKPVLKCRFRSDSIDKS